jgi:hypothetical protein
MFQQQDEFKQIDDTAILWRYQDLPRYLDLLLKQQLFFCRADKFEDPFEGKYPVGNPDKLIQEYVERTAATQSSKKSFKNAKEEIEKMVEDSVSKRTFVTINSWHYNTDENYAMWKIYAKGTYGIAIQTTYERLKRSFKVADQSVFIGKVSYYDDLTAPLLSPESLKPFLCKRKMYEYENEIRCCYVISAEEKALNWQDQGSQDGIFINVDLNTLIERIYISPYSPKWIADIVKGINEKFGMNKEIMHSSIFDATEY